MSAICLCLFYRDNCGKYSIILLNMRFQFYETFVKLGVNILNVLNYTFLHRSNVNKCYLQRLNESTDLLIQYLLSLY